ncbi:hypothetical protein [Streptomyces sp. MCL20-2]|uniref:hypothetical protein n=1 Tax=Streptomyces sp. MCL20-2 TaxID=2967219 RepID=UPI0029672EFC|nr:hypothetical protein [Streptomyces sp. MCL20-2]
MLVRNAARTDGRRPARTGLRAGALAVVVAAALVSCTQASSGGGPDADVRNAADPAAADAARGAGNADSAENTDQAEREAGEAEPTAVPSPGPELVRDAFATLQATLNETCTPGAGDCAYFLGRVTRELTELDESMRADAKGSGHFKKPLADMKALFDKLGDDRSEAHLEKHFSEIVGTRDGINAWMQDHPDDYR